MAGKKIKTEGGGVNEEGMNEWKRSRKEEGSVDEWMEELVLEDKRAFILPRR